MPYISFSPIPPSLYLSIYLSIYLSLSVYMYTHIYLSLSLSLSRSVSLSLPIIHNQSLWGPDGFSLSSPHSCPHFVCKDKSPSHQTRTYRKQAKQKVASSKFCLERLADAILAFWDESRSLLTQILLNFVMPVDSKVQSS